jgi:hypothetical protein
MGRRFPLIIALAKSDRLDGAAPCSTLFAKSFILKLNQPADIQLLTNNSTRNDTLCLVKMIKRPKQLELT